MKQKDLQIICQLRQDARMPLTKMSKITRIPVSTIFDRIKTNELIIKHTTLLDFEKLGFHTRAQITIKVEKQDKEELQNHLIKSAQINTIYRINNGYDFMIEGVFKQIKEMEEYLDKLEKKYQITDIKSYFIIEDLKKEEFYSNPNLIPN